MTTERLYKKADHADEIGDLDLKDADKIVIARSCYDAWLAGCKDVFYDEGFFLYMARNSDKWEEQCEPLYQKACKIIAPYKEKINGTLHTAYFDLKRFLNKDEFYEYYSGYSGNYPPEIKMAGIYLSALLNETGLDKLVVDEEDKKFHGSNRWIELYHLGWRMKPGKVLEILEGCVSGTAERAEGGIVVNYATVAECGAHSSNMVIVNYRSGSWGKGAKNGIFINMDDGDSIGNESENCTLVDFGNTTRHEISTGDFKADKIYHVESKDIWRSEQLTEFGHALEEAGKRRDIQKIAELARQVDAHVRKTRKPEDEERRMMRGF